MTDRYAVFGSPIVHSKSPRLHMAFAEQTGEDISYEPIEPAKGSFAQTVRDFIDAGGKGINVTAPFKLEAFALATKRHQPAETAGSANCLKFDGAEIVAENFDGIGLLNDIQRNLGYAIAGKSVLFLGAGGATRGAIVPFMKAGPASITIVNRTVEKAMDLKTAFSGFGELNACGYDDLGDAPFDLVLNATSASLFGDLPPLPASVFGANTLAYELAYGKGLTPFLRLAKTHGAERLADGVGMLVEQAAEAFEWWRGVRPDTAPMIDALTVPLE